MIKTFSAAGVAMMVVAASAQAAPRVQAPWSRPASQGATGAGFMVLVNSGAKPDALVMVESTGARQVQIHQSSVSGGMAAMKMVASVPIPAGSKVIFAPGGYHLMFLGLSKAQKVGDSLPATLVFASGARIKVVFTVGLKDPEESHAGH